MTPEDQAAFDRRWSLARDGFGLERDDEHGRYVHLDDAVAVLHAALAHRDAQAQQLNQQDDLQPAANWIYNGLHPCEISDIQENLMVDYKRAKRLYDAAIAAAEALKAKLV